MEGLLAGARPQRRGFRVGAGGAGPPLSALMKASVRAELPQSLFTKGHHTRSCPPRLPKPPSARPGPFSPGFWVFLLLSSLPDLLTVRGVAAARGPHS